MNTMQKMRRTNVIIKKRMKQEGYYDIVMFPHTRHFKDVWGLWDGVCKIEKNLPNRKGFDIAWLQFKTGYATVKDKNDMRDFCMKSGSRGILAELIPYQEKYKNKKGSYTKKKIRITKL